MYLKMAYWVGQTNMGNVNVWLTEAVTRENIMATVKVFKKDENNSFNFQKHVPGYPYILCCEMEATSQFNK